MTILRIRSPRSENERPRFHGCCRLRRNILDGTHHHLEQLSNVTQGPSSEISLDRGAQQLRQDVTWQPRNGLC